MDCILKEPCPFRKQKAEHGHKRVGSQTPLKMEDNDSDNYLLGNANRRLLFSSQLSQGFDTSQRANAATNENSIDKSLDIRLLSQTDFLTPAVQFVNSCLCFSSPRKFLLKYLTLYVILLTLLEFLEKRLKRSIPLEPGPFSNENLDMVDCYVMCMIERCATF